MGFFKDDRVKKNIFIGFVLILIYFIFNNISFIYAGFLKVINISIPFIIGGAIAFILNVPMKKLETYFFKKKNQDPESGWGKLRRALSLIITILLTLVVIVLLLYMVIPQLVITISQLIRQIPTGVNQITVWADDKFDRYPIIMDIVDGAAMNWQSIVENIASVLKDYFSQLVEGGVSAVAGILSGITNLIIGLVFAIYILIQKEHLYKQLIKLLYSFFSKETADKLMDLGSITSGTFARFVSGQCVEAVILGLMFFITMTIIRLPYAILVSLLISVTALIPIVGAFIGCGIGFLLILIENPVKAVIFLAVFLVLQQLEGNLIYPKVVGSSVGLPGIWVLVSVTIGGSLFGVTGMIVFIPLASVTYALVRHYVYTELNKKKITEDDIEEMSKTNEIDMDNLVRRRWDDDADSEGNQEDNQEDNQEEVQEEAQEETQEEAQDDSSENVEKLANTEETEETGRVDSTEESENTQEEKSKRRRKRK